MLNIRVESGQISKHFNITEFTCHANNEILLNEDFLNHVKRLEVFREWYNRPMKINSGYRTLAYNRKIGSSDGSRHIKGTATDIALPSEFYNFGKGRQEQFLENIKEKWIDICHYPKKHGLDVPRVDGGFGIYKSFWHCDSRQKSKSSRGYSYWDNR